jgi:hypothetical protein
MLRVSRDSQGEALVCSDYIPKTSYIRVRSNNLIYMACYDHFGTLVVNVTTLKFHRYVTR